MIKVLRSVFGIRHSLELKDLLARAESRAREYSHDYIGVEHVFLSILELAESHRARIILSCLPIDAPAFWPELERQAKIITGRPVPKFLPYTPRLQVVLRTSEKWAKVGSSPKVTVLHFVAAVANEGNSLVAVVFREALKKKGFTQSEEQKAAAYLTTLMTSSVSQIFHT